MARRSSKPASPATSWYRNHFICSSDAPTRTRETTDRPAPVPPRATARTQRPSPRRQPESPTAAPSDAGPARRLARQLGVLHRSVFFTDEWTPHEERRPSLQEADVGLMLHRATPEAPFAARARYMAYLWTALPCVVDAGDPIA